VKTQAMHAPQSSGSSSEEFFPLCEFNNCS